jgi:ABC-type taurine transport system ATPase subunit
MLTKLEVRRFKGLPEATIPLGDAVVFVGPNNSGKTTALQALTLWDIGLRKWAERRRESSARERTGVTVNRRDLLAIPVPNARLLWQGLRVREVGRDNGKQRTQNVTFEVEVEGVHLDRSWVFGLEFDFANEESIYCRATRWPEEAGARAALLEAALASRIAYLPPMSGLAAQEYRKEPGELGVLIGEGRTAEVLRNLCHRVHALDSAKPWQTLVKRMKSLFGVDLRPPEYLPERSELRMEYEQEGLALDLCCAGRGFQQTLLLLAYLHLNTRSVLLLDEPDAHLEVIRQRAIYNLVTETAREQGSQVIAASHSEVVLNEAAERDLVVAFLGRPHVLQLRRKSHAAKSLKSIPFDLYFLAERKGWILFLEGSTDLAILRSLARRFHPDWAEVLDDAPVHYLNSNVPDHAQDVFQGLLEARPDLRGVALFDRLPAQPEPGTSLLVRSWRRREIENYIVTPRVLDRFARRESADDLFGRAEAERRAETMSRCIAELEEALARLGRPSPWSPDIKITDEFLDPLFRNYFARLGLPQLVFKRDYHLLADLLEAGDLDPEAAEEIRQILMCIWGVAGPFSTRAGTDA